MPAPLIPTSTFPPLSSLMTPPAPPALLHTSPPLLDPPDPPGPHLLLAVSTKPNDVAECPERE
eukprot:3937386-Rhodomonas_salina.2